MKKTTIIFILLGALNLNAAKWLIDESPRQRTWESAIDYCDFKGGRLPTIEELKSSYKSGIKGAFKKDFYWSSSEYVLDFDQAYYFNHKNSKSFYSPKAFKMWVRCIAKTK